MSFYQQMVIHSSYQGNHLGRLIVELMSKLLVVGDKVCDVHVAVVLFDERIFSNLIAEHSLDRVQANEVE